MRCSEATLLYIAKGHVSIVHDAGQLLLHSGMLAFLPAKREYRGIPEPVAETVTVYLDPVFASEQLRWLPCTGPFFETLLNATEPHPIQISPLHRSAVVQKLLEMVAVERNNSDSTRELRVFELLAALLSLISPAEVDPSDRTGLPLRREVSLAMEVLDAGLEQRWSIDRLASAVVLSSSQLTRLFTAQVGVTPARYIREMRAHRMRELLTPGHMTVAQAARAVGWQNPSVASRAYRMVFGYPPSAQHYRADRPQLQTEEATLVQARPKT